MAAAPINPLQQPEPRDYYQALFDALGTAYWDASDIASKDQIQGARDTVLTILNGIDEADLATDTAEMVRLTGVVNQLQPALVAIQTDVAKIVRNIDTAGTLLSAIAKVLSLGGTFV
jgi:hypothetical protein